jgi:hypothetical protein
VYHFPKVGDATPVPDDIKNLYDGIPFDRLIDGGDAYNVTYKRAYYLDAILRVYDKRGVYGTTESKKIDIN